MRGTRLAAFEAKETYKKVQDRRSQDLAKGRYSVLDLCPQLSVLLAKDSLQAS